MNGPIEMYGSPPYIDFHFNNSTADYTSRIIEESPGHLSIAAELSVGSYLHSLNRYNHNVSNVVNMIDDSHGVTLQWVNNRLAVYVNTTFIGYMQLGQ